MILTPRTNTSSIELIWIPVTDLSIAKTAGSENATPGQTRLQYTIVVTNAGPSVAHGASITDDLPEGLRNVRYTSTVNGKVQGNTENGQYVIARRGFHGAGQLRSPTS